MASSPGFLAKMAQLVRKAPAEDDADESQQSKQDDFSQSDLRARIEGKRRDDQVRRREFNHLRKIRANNGLGSLSMMSTSAFQVSSGFNHEEVSSADRAHTLKKIDAIEAYMGEHLRQKRQAAQPGQTMPPRPAATGGGMRDLPVLTQSVGGLQRTTTLPTSKPSAAAPAPAPESVQADLDMDLDFTGVLSNPVPLQAEPEDDKAEAVSTLSGYSESRLESQELGLDHPALQDAAIRFAEGDAAGAEAALLAVMQDDSDLSSADRCACALMDLYRATDQSAAFDVVAIEYAQRFGRSAPEWYSIPELLRKSSAAHAADAAPAAGAAWVCPPLLTAQGVAQLAANQQGATRQLQWGQLQSIAPDALPALTRLLTQWAEQPVALDFAGAAELHAVLQGATQTGERATDPAWWMLRLEALRVAGQHEEFETVALDYCVTYDVSPPSWLEAKCTYSSAAQAAVPQDAGLAFPVLDSMPQPLFSDTRWPDGPELRGELLGDAQAVMDKLAARGHIVGEPLVIDCKRLVRVDFAAVGSMLNWLALRRSQGVEVQFVQVPRLVGAFFQLMGISEHAGVAITTK